MASELFKSIGRFRSKHFKNNRDFQPDIRELRSPQTGTRRDTRIATYRLVEICSECGEILTGATIRDLSKNGALLELKSQEQLPARLLVRSAVEPSANVATLKWISAGNAGVEFDNEVGVPSGPPDVHERIRVISAHLAVNSTINAPGETDAIGPNGFGGHLPEPKILELLRGNQIEPACCP